MMVRDVVTVRAVTVFGSVVVVLTVTAAASVAVAVLRVVRVHGWHLDT